MVREQNGRRRRVLLGVLVCLTLLVPIVSAAPPNDERDDAEPILLPAYRDETDTTGAHINWNDPWSGCARANGYSDHTVWYAYTALTPISIRVSTAGSDHDTVLDAFTENADGTLTRVACSHNPGLTPSEFVLEPVVGTVYWIQAGSFSLAWGPSPGGLLVLTVEPALE